MRMTAAFAVLAVVGSSTTAGAQSAGPAPSRLVPIEGRVLVTLAGATAGSPVSRPTVVPPGSIVEVTSGNARLVHNGVRLFELREGARLTIGKEAPEPSSAVLALDGRPDRIRLLPLLQAGTRPSAAVRIRGKQVAGLKARADADGVLIGFDPVPGAFEYRLEFESAGNVIFGAMVREPAVRIPGAALGGQGSLRYTVSAIDSSGDRVEASGVFTWPPA